VVKLTNKKHARNSRTLVFCLVDQRFEESATYRCSPFIRVDFPSRSGPQLA
jgi:hypothetical protein